MWEGQLKEWDEILPPEQPADAEQAHEMVRLWQWATNITDAVKLYESVVCEAREPEKMQDTLEVMQAAQRKAARKVRRLLETVEMTVDILRVTGGADLETALARLEAD
jgi:hypothetical protein